MTQENDAMTKADGATARTQAIKILRCARVTINDQWEGSTGYISEAEAVRLVDELFPNLDAALSRIRELTQALHRISDGYGPDHGSKFAYEIARAALHPAPVCQSCKQSLAVKSITGTHGLCCGCVDGGFPLLHPAPASGENALTPDRKAQT